MGSGKFEIILFGHFQLIAPNGEELSISGLGEKPKALLAILATRPHQPVARTYLQDKLWSDRGETQGRNSLKQALRQVRGVFKQFGEDIIRSNGGPVGIDRDRVWIDLHDSDPAQRQFEGEFLEGIDIKDPQFNIWLSSMRAAQEAPNARLVSASRSHKGALSEEPKIGILPVVYADGDFKAQMLGNTLLDRVVNAVSFYELYGFHDFREVEHSGGRGSDYLLSTRAMSLGSDISISMSLERSADSRRIWGHQVLLDLGCLSSSQLSNLTIEVSDRLLHRVDSDKFISPTSERNAAKLVMEGIDRLFRPSEPSVRDAVIAFENACEIEPKSSFLAWQAYSAAHVLELDRDAEKESVLERTEVIAAQALELDSFNPLTRILLTHVYSFIFRDLERADNLIGALRQSPPDTPLYYYVLGCLRNYQQDMEAAKNAAFRARALGKHSPYAHMFSSLATMTACMSGDYETAIRMGEEALSKQPKSIPGFGPTVRYLATAYASSGNMTDAVRVHKNLLSGSPNFRAEKLLDPAFPVPSLHAREILHQAFSKIEERAF